MKIHIKPMGVYQTNCYIVEGEEGSMIIDPGVDATSWVLKTAKNPIAILNTHGHFDHVWSNASLQKELSIPLYVPEDDAFMLADDPFAQGTPSSCPDVKVQGDESFNIGEFHIKFIHLPGHTPGCSIIQIGDTIFSGDFLFKGSIGRTDFPYSDPQKMVQSIEKFMKLGDDLVVYPGHGEPTSVKAEQAVLPRWISYLS